MELEKTTALCTKVNLKRKAHLHSVLPWPFFYSSLEIIICCVIVIFLKCLCYVCKVAHKYPLEIIPNPGSKYHAYFQFMLISLVVCEVSIPESRTQWDPGKQEGSCPSP
jgi:hypothetical protein